MRHLHSGNKLGVTAPHRKALLRSLTLALIEKETIQTIPARAKELRWFADRMVTLAKRGDVASRRQIVRILGSTETHHVGENRVRNAVAKLYSDYAPRFKNRNGGYTQMIRLVGRRPGDNAEQCIFRYLPDESENKASSAKKPTDKKRSIKAKAAPAEEQAEKVKSKSSKAPEDKPAKSKKRE